MVEQNFAIAAVPNGFIVYPTRPVRWNIAVHGQLNPLAIEAARDVSIPGEKV
jgi:hypothetical protein